MLGYAAESGSVMTMLCPCGAVYSFSRETVKSIQVTCRLFNIVGQDCRFTDSGQVCGALASSEFWGQFMTRRLCMHTIHFCRPGCVIFQSWNGMEHWRVTCSEKPRYCRILYINYTISFILTLTETYG